MDDEFKRESINFGLNEEFHKLLSSFRVNSVSQISDSEYIACSNRELYLFSAGKMVKSFPYRLFLAQYIPELNFIVGISCGIPHLTIIDTRKGFPIIFDDFRLKSVFVQQIIYSHEHKILISAGSGVEIYNFEIKESRFSSQLQVKITMRAQIPAKDIGNKVCHVYFDKHRSRLLIPTLYGFALYDINGVMFKDHTSMSSLPLRTASCIHFGKQFDENTTLNLYKHFLATDGDGLIRIWDPSGKVLRHFNLTGSAFMYTEFINSEFVLCISTLRTVSILDCKCGKFLHIMTLPNSPDFIRVFHNQYNHNEYPKLVMVVDNIIYVYKIVMPWKLWHRTASPSVTIHRYPSPDSAARIALGTADSLISLIQPQTGQLLCTIGHDDPMRAVKFIYDRGCFISGTKLIKTKNDSTVKTLASSMLKAFGGIQAQNILSADRIITLNEDHSVYVFKAFKQGFKFAEKYDLKAYSLNQARIYNPPRPVFCCFTQKGDLFLVNYYDFTQIVRIQVENQIPVYVHFHDDSHSLVSVYTDKIIQINFDTMTIIGTYPINDKVVLAASDNNLMIVACESETIMLWVIEPTCLVEQGTFRCLSHVRCLACEYHCFAFALENNEVRIGTSIAEIVMITVPFRVFGLGFLNNNLDLLVALDSEIMVIHRERAYPFLQPTPTVDYDIDDIKSENLLQFQSPKIAHLLGLGHMPDDDEDDKRREKMRKVRNMIRLQKLKRKQQEALMAQSMPEEDKEQKPKEASRDIAEMLKMTMEDPRQPPELKREEKGKEDEGECEAEQNEDQPVAEEKDSKKAKKKPKKKKKKKQDDLYIDMYEFEDEYQAQQAAKRKKKQKKDTKDPNDPLVKLLDENGEPVENNESESESEYESDDDIENGDDEDEYEYEYEDVEEDIVEENVTEVPESQEGNPDATKVVTRMITRHVMKKVRKKVVKEPKANKSKPELTNNKANSDSKEQLMPKEPTKNTRKSPRGTRPPEKKEESHAPGASNEPKGSGEVKSAIPKKSKFDNFDEETEDYDGDTDVPSYEMKTDLSNPVTLKYSIPSTSSAPVTSSTLQASTPSTQQRAKKKKFVTRGKKKNGQAISVIDSNGTEISQPTSTRNKSPNKKGQQIITSPRIMVPNTKGRTAQSYNASTNATGSAIPRTPLLPSSKPLWEETSAPTLQLRSKLMTADPKARASFITHTVVPDQFYRENLLGGFDPVDSSKLSELDPSTRLYNLDSNGNYVYVTTVGELLNPNRVRIQTPNQQSNAVGGQYTSILQQSGSAGQSQGTKRPFTYFYIQNEDGSFSPISAMFGLDPTTKLYRKKADGTFELIGTLESIEKFPLTPVFDNPSTIYQKTDDGSFKLVDIASKLDPNVQVFKKTLDGHFQYLGDLTSIQEENKPLVLYTQNEDGTFIPVQSLDSLQINDKIFYKNQDGAFHFIGTPVANQLLMRDDNGEFVPLPRIENLPSNVKVYIQDDDGNISFIGTTTIPKVYIKLADGTFAPLESNEQISPSTKIYIRGLDGEMLALGSANNSMIFYQTEDGTIAPVLKETHLPPNAKLFTISPTGNLQYLKDLVFQNEDGSFSPVTQIPIGAKLFCKQPDGSVKPVNQPNATQLFVMNNDGTFHPVSSLNEVTEGVQVYTVTQTGDMQPCQEVFIRNDDGSISKVNDFSQIPPDAKVLMKTPNGQLKAFTQELENKFFVQNSDGSFSPAPPNPAPGTKLFMQQPNGVMQEIGKPPATKIFIKHPDGTFTAVEKLSDVPLGTQLFTSTNEGKMQDLEEIFVRDDKGKLIQVTDFSQVKSDTKIFKRTLNGDVVPLNSENKNQFYMRDADGSFVPVDSLNSIDPKVKLFMKSPEGEIEYVGSLNSIMHSSNQVAQLFVKDANGEFVPVTSIGNLDPNALLFRKTTEGEMAYVGPVSSLPQASYFISNGNGTFASLESLIQLSYNSRVFKRAANGSFEFVGTGQLFLQYYHLVNNKFVPLETVLPNTQVYRMNLDGSYVALGNAAALNLSISRSPRININKAQDIRPLELSSKQPDLTAKVLYPIPPLFVRERIERNGIYDLTAMKRIVFETHKKKKVVPNLNPVGNIELAIQVLSSRRINNK